MGACWGRYLLHRRSSGVTEPPEMVIASGVARPEQQSSPWARALQSSYIKTHIRRVMHDLKCSADLPQIEELVIVVWATVIQADGGSLGDAPVIRQVVTEGAASRAVGFHLNEESVVLAHANDANLLVIVIAGAAIILRNRHPYRALTKIRYIRTAPIGDIIKNDVGSQRREGGG